MPKGKKKGKYEHRRTEQAYSSDEDAGIDMTIDNCSETSAQSDLKSNHDDAGKLSGTQWGRKTGENRIIRTESIDIGLQHQAIKWKELDVKWSGPRLVNEGKVEPEPVKETPTYCYYPYRKPIEEEVKPDKRKYISEYK